MTREEYDELFLCCVRLTDRIEALERLGGAGPPGWRTWDNHTAEMLDEALQKSGGQPVWRTTDGRYLSQEEYQREFADKE